ncbi:LysM peptidoglycan-binding domain-containing protein [Streptococcus suis]|uniref:LysM peptidoglycan-binding domain-containing protein n=1 Tax=Streptococcus suis TaxID=1307 RepID=UPI001ABE1D9E|nr:LysM peptidoglycan-binding domain-containing protein [Streptococcus suis]
MKWNKRIFLASTMALTMFSSQVKADTLNWTPRSVDEISADIIASGSKETYTIQYGDTLSTIANAMAIDMEVLAKVNQITNLDLIFPDTVLTTTLDANHQVTEIEIVTPTPENPQETVEATVDLQMNEVVIESKSNEVVVENKTVDLNQVEVTTEASEEAATEPSPTEVPTEETTSEVQEAPIATPEAQVAPVETPAVQVAPATQESEQETTASTDNLSSQETTATSPSTSTTTETNTIISSSAENAGLQAHVIAYKDEVKALFGLSNVGGYRAGDSGDHGSGLALDFMVPESSSLGDQIAEYSIANMASKKISYIIWKQRFYSPFASIYGPAYTWNLMPDRGSVTENHYDHVHVSFNQ